MEDPSFDAGVASALLCTVADPARVLSELFRVIRPGGELRFYEHVRASSLGLALIQRIVDGGALGGTPAGVEVRGDVQSLCVRQAALRPPAGGPTPGGT